ncbi:RdRp [Cercospora beticola negative-stranded virus 3]|uniref:RNA-directed RNA polymerase n=1 Tax=Cercospora beticola negative-stranded virus 3 TaxID=2973211 RepID=A0A976XHS7_9MONO|nr:RdRp [Cercospora beticola negative-stranded virus 3]
MNFETEFDDLVSASRVFFLDTNLSSPVLLTEIEDTRKLIHECILKTTNKSEYYRTVKFHRQNSVEFLIKLCKLRDWNVTLLKRFGPLQPTEYGKIERHMLNPPDSRYTSYYDEAKEAAQELESALVAGLRARGLPEDEIKGTTEMLGGNSCLPYRRAYEEFCNLFARAESRVKNSPHTWTLGTVGAVRFWITSTNALIEFDSQMYYSSLNQVLMLKDKVATRYMMLEHVGPLGLSLALESHLLKLYKWQDCTLEYYGNQAYNLLKAVEPMFKTWLSHNVDNIFGSDTAYTRMKAKMTDKEESVAKTTHLSNRNLMSGLYTIVEEVHEVRSIVELFGCLKTSGHPLIDTELGGLSAAEAARSDDKTSVVDSQRLRNTFCHIVLTAYIAKHGSWPKLYHANSQTSLKKLNDRQYRNLTRSSYPLSDWNTTEWTKLFDFDYFPNFLELMDDKSISLYRSDKHLTWDKGPRPKSNRRLLLECLKRKTVDIKAIVDRVSARDVPNDWKIVSLYPKEREFKLEPRMFAMLVLEMRCFFTAIEANIAENVFRYLPQQTMTKSKTQNQERFLKFTDPLRSRADYTLFLEIDLTRWNLKWRELSIHAIGHDLNRMFGMKGTFTVTHWFFAAAQIVVRVGGLRPEGIEQDNPPISNLAWRDHKGGFEGLNQKLWTAATYAMVEMALSPLLEAKTISDYEVIGQGDNQVVRVSIPASGRCREDVIPEVRDLLNEALERTCASVNQEVKPEENIESTSVLTYSKDVLVRGVEYPTSLKKHSRLFPVTSMDFPSVISNTRAILAGAIAGGENALYPLRSAIIGHYHAYRYLKAASSGYSIHAKAYPKLNHIDIQTALIIPSSLGGLCGPAYASFFYKGGSDPLGKEISGVKFLADGDTCLGVIASRTLASLEHKYYISEAPNIATLIDNPYGLPLETAVSPLSKVGALTLDAFRGVVDNRDIAPLLRTSVDKAELTLKEDLLKIRPFNPILIHDLFEASGFGSIKLMKKMFVHTRTIQTVAQQNNGQITHTFLRADVNEIMSYKRWTKGLLDLRYSGKSSFELCTLYRSYWAVDLKGVTNEQPLDYTHWKAPDKKPSSIHWSSHSADNLLDTRGPLTGYIGTATREKRSEHGYKIVDTGAPSRSVMKLQLIRSQAYGNPSFNNLLDRISLTRSPVPLSTISDVLPKVVGGSISHRYASSIRSMGASYVGPLNFATHTRVDTDNISKLSGSVVNYPVMLQEFIIMAQAGAKMMHLHFRSSAGGLYLPFDSLIPLDDDSLSCDPPDFEPKLLPRSTLSYSPTLALKRTLETDLGSIPRGSLIPPMDYQSFPIVWLSVVNFFTSTLRDSNRAKTIADTRGHISLPSSFQIDIAEAHALGAMRLGRAIAHAVTHIVIRDTFRTLHLHPERWDESLFLDHNIRVCVKTILAYLTHPIFQTHKDYLSLRYSTLRYGRALSVTNRMIALIRREVRLIFSKADHPFWTERTAVFSGEGSSALTEALVVHAAIRLRWLYAIGHPKASLYSRTFNGFTINPRGVTLTPQESLNRTALQLTRLAKFYRTDGDELLSGFMMKLSSFQGLAIFNDDQRTVMRFSRAISPTLYCVRNVKPTSVVKTLESAPTHCLNCCPPSSHKHTTMWSRYKTRKHGGVSSAGYTWLPIVSTLEIQPTCFVIGNGNGGLADLLLTSYNVEVVGLDLESDMPTNSATLLNYFPLGISVKNKTRFRQSDVSINTTGNWLEKSVRTLLMTETNTTSTVIVDITGPAAIDVLSSTLDAMDTRSVVSAYCRLIGSRDDISGCIRSLPRVVMSRLWVVSHSTFEIEIILELSRTNSSAHLCTGAGPLIDYPLDRAHHELIPQRRDELLEAATRSVHAWTDETFPSMYEITRSLCKSLLNKPKSTQLRYTERYDLILAYCVLTVRVSSSPVELVQSWILDERAETDLFYYCLNESTISHLIRYSARLLTWSDTSMTV